MSSEERAGSACNNVISSIEQATIPVLFGDVSSVERVGSACNNAVSSIEQAIIPVLLGTCPAWSGPAVLVIMQSPV